MSLADGGETHVTGAAEAAPAPVSASPAASPIPTVITAPVLARRPPNRLLEIPLTREDERRNQTDEIKGIENSFVEQVHWIRAREYPLE
ncbi:hypothetical protein RQCS_14800 [Rhodococcus qingshengii]|nr:hypothetical protein RE2895_14890 [Rhodococcus erythropolis]BCF81935.1 hypothetical protein RQCS_14800 [Rhodococcus qingshengii]GCB55112.1 hypothetical protein rerp_15200 [Rhodococcus erythropolis]